MVTPPCSDCADLMFCPVECKVNVEWDGGGHCQAEMSEIIMTNEKRVLTNERQVLTNERVVLTNERVVLTNERVVLPKVWSHRHQIHPHWPGECLRCNRIKHFKFLILFLRSYFYSQKQQGLFLIYSYKPLKCFVFII